MFNQTLLYRILGIALIFLILYGLNFIIKSERLKRSITPLNFFVGTIIYIAAYMMAFKTATNVKTAGQSDTVWSATYKKNLYLQIDSSVDTIFLDTSKRHVFCECCVQKIEALLPKGLESVSKDSLNKLNFKVGKECAEPFKNDVRATMKWTPENIKEFRDTLMSGKLKAIDYAPRKFYCDCVIKDLESKYPNGIALPLVDSIYSPSTKLCAKLMVKKFKKK